MGWQEQYYKELYQKNKMSNSTWHQETQHDTVTHKKSIFNLLSKVLWKLKCVYLYPDSLCIEWSVKTFLSTATSLARWDKKGCKLNMTPWKHNMTLWQMKKSFNLIQGLMKVVNFCVLYHNILSIDSSCVAKNNTTKNYSRNF